MNKTKTLLKDSAVFMISGIASKVIMFLLLPLYTRVLSTTEFGIADLITTITAMAYPCLTLSISESLLRFTLGKEIVKSKLVSFSTMIVIGSLISAGLLSGLISLVNADLLKYRTLLLIYYCTYTINNIMVGYTQGGHLTKCIGIQGILQTSITALLSILLIPVLKLGVYGYIGAMCFAQVVSFGYLSVKTKYFTEMHPFSTDKETVKKALKYSLPMVPTFLVWWVMNSADKLFIINYIGIDASGIYSAAHKIPSILTICAEYFTSALLLSVVENVSEKDNASYYSQIHDIYISSLLLVCGFLVTFTKPIGSVLFGAGYSEACIYMPLLLLASLFSAYSSFYSSFFRAATKTKPLMVTTIIGAIANVVLNALLIPTHGMIGAAVATAFSFLCIWLIRLYYSQKLVHLSNRYIKTILCLLLLILQIVITTSQIQYGMIICFVILAVLFLINFKDMKCAIVTVAKTVKER